MQRPSAAADSTTPQIVSFLDGSSRQDELPAGDYDGGRSHASPRSPPGCGRHLGDPRLPTPQIPPPLPRHLHPRLPPRPPRPPACAPPPLRLPRLRRRQPVPRRLPLRPAKARRADQAGLAAADHALPRLIYGYNCFDDRGQSLDIIPFDHRAAADQLQSVARLDQASDFYNLEASCDGLVVLSFRDRHFGICNPATRQYAPLWLPSGFKFVAMYFHPPTAEYRLLIYPCWILDYQVVPGSEDDCYVLSLGSGQPPRNIGPGEAHKLIFDAKSVLFRGRLHWYRMQHEGESNMIIVFDITAESFGHMHVPVVRGCACDDLFEMDGMLGMSSFNDTATIIDIWVLQDYESEVWTIKCQIELPLTEIRAWCGKHDELWDVVVVPGDGELLVLVKFAEWLLQVDMDGKLVATFHRKGVRPTQFQLKQTLVPHSFFPTLEGYVVNDFPFI